MVLEALFGSILKTYRQDITAACCLTTTDISTGVVLDFHGGGLELLAATLADERTEQRGSPFSCESGA